MMLTTVSVLCKTVVTGYSEVVSTPESFGILHMFCVLDIFDRSRHQQAYYTNAVIE